ncbi:nucleotidyltransferase domain-containing protein [Cohnella fermenti]|uniref:Nucleotidyltransferase domain-containing protein n=1 Tax=Cohnella fermenti TaxID=2565925 RepID=A0A4S4CB34_9BACL|nr:nucleotidyltransferase domain-containing protein [Cohnella fermenti]THF84688.1 nucleotidyltransferase domain-containing protein [Cohnella fermenti]
MDSNSVIEIAKNYAELVANELPVTKVILYGSQVKGNQNNDSDIDIAVIVDRIDEDFLDTEAKLFRLRRNLDLRIEPILLEEQKDKSGFINQIINDGYVLIG